MKRLLDLPFKWHLFFGIVIRLALIAYGDYHDNNYDVPYTDVDYKVFTDAARHVVNGNSPYNRHTYRYSPIIAYILTPNVFFNKHFGKVLFCIFDILITVAAKRLVENQLQTKKVDVDKVSKYCSFFWLYNPLSIGISTRGNADSFPCCLIILSVLILQTGLVKSLFRYILSGFLLGVAIHLRLYPLAFSFPMYLSLGEYKINRNTKLTESFLNLLPNKKQILLASSCVVTLAVFTFGMYVLYGYDFLFETYIYHLFRKDTRHNFSVLFYYSYLTTDQLAFDIVKAISQIFECVILFVLSLAFGCDPKTLPFALFCQSIVLVAYNSVMTSQYFVWFLSLLPLVVHNFVLSPVSAVFLATIWFLAQGAWLFYAYLLEFKSREVFNLLWLKGVLFFSTNVYILGKLVTSYNPDYAFGVNSAFKKNNK